jgi:signal recognition particle subunit SEC65
VRKLKKHTRTCLPKYLKQDLDQPSENETPDSKPKESDENLHNQGQNINCADCGKPCTSIGNLIKHRMKCFSGGKVMGEEVNQSVEEAKLSSVEKNEPVCDLIVKDEVPDYGCTTEGLEVKQGNSIWQDNIDDGDQSSSEQANPESTKKQSGGDSKRPMACNQCPKILANKKNFKDHMLRKHSEEKRVVCEYCAQDFKSTNIKSHIREMHFDCKRQRQMACNLCPKILANKKNFRDHMLRKHSEEKRVVCEYCAQDFKSTNIKNHIKEMHINFIESKCPKCDKIFPRKKAMLDHMRTVHAEEKGVCDICCKTFVNKTYLQRHIRTFHNNSDIFHPCQYCTKQYRSKVQLRNHLEIVHTGSNVENYTRTSFC